MLLSDLIALAPGAMVVQIPNPHGKEPETVEFLIYVRIMAPHRCGHNDLCYGFSAYLPVSSTGVPSNTYIGIYPVMVPEGQEPKDGPLSFFGKNNVLSLRKATEKECKDVTFSYIRT